MLRWVGILLCAVCVGCEVESEVEGEGEPDGGPADSGPPASESLGFTHAAVHAGCGQAGQGALVLVLSDQPGCEVAEGTTRIELVVFESPALPFPLEPPLAFPIGGDSPVQGHVIEGGVARPIVDGLLRITALSMLGEATGTYALELDGEDLVGHFAAQACTPAALAEGDERACYPHQPRPGLDQAPVDGVCPGTYAVTALEFTVPAFNPEIVNRAAARQLASGDLLLDLVFQDPQTATVVDAIAGRGGHIPDPAVPDGEPMGLFPDGQGGFFTRERGEAILLIGPFLPEDGYEAPETIFFMVQAALFGQFSNDCSTFEGRLDGAFADRDGYTIPGNHDTDTNGDGVLDGFAVSAALRAHRLPD